jgi:hypothetical protein
VIEQIAAVLPDWAELFFYRTHDGTEAELVIARAGVPEILIELKNSTSPKPSRGFILLAMIYKQKGNMSSVLSKRDFLIGKMFR